MFSNKTMENRSFVHQDRIVLYAGHIFIVFYCLIFLLGFLGMQEMRKQNDILFIFLLRLRKFCCYLRWHSKEELSQCNELLCYQSCVCWSLLHILINSIYDVSWSCWYLTIGWKIL